MRNAVRKERNIFKVLDDDTEDYEKQMSEAISNNSTIHAPAMPVISYTGGNPLSGGSTEHGGSLSLEDTPRAHQDHDTHVGYQCDDLFAMVHKPVKLPDARKIPDAKAALEKEWMFD